MSKEDIGDATQTWAPSVTGYSLPDLASLPALKNDLLLQSAANKNPLSLDHPPIWVMRQAGRYLPEFMAVRAKHSFFDVCRTPELACEVTLQPIDRYDGLLDAAIIFSDILVVAQAFGFVVEMRAGQGPVFPAPLTDPQDATARLLPEISVYDELKYVYAAITLTRRKLAGRVPLIGFCSGPWTLFGYMVEGGGSKTWEKTKNWTYRWPESAHEALGRIADVSAEYLAYQVLAGAQLLQVFDTNADCVSATGFETFVLPYLSALPRLVESHLRKKGFTGPVPPLTVFAKGSNTASQLDALSRAGYATVGVDWSLTPREARRLTGNRVALQGNMDPAVLSSGSRDAIKANVHELVAGPNGFLTVAREDGPAAAGWIVNLGHGITPTVKPDDMRYFLERVREECRLARDSTTEAEGR